MSHYPDRRQSRRILTLKNFRNATLVAIGIIAGMTIYAHVRAPKAEEGFGRLYGNRVPASDVVKQREAIQATGQIDDSIAADPMLVGAQARAQILTGESDPHVQVIPTDPSLQPPQAPLLNAETAGHLTVVGGPEGVKIVKDNVPRPELGGGFGRQ